MIKWLLLAGAILSEVTGSLSLKGALDQPALYALVALGFVAAFAFLTSVLRQGMALGVAYGVWAACGVGRRLAGVRLLRAVRGHVYRLREHLERQCSLMAPSWRCVWAPVPGWPHE